MNTQEREELIRKPDAVERPYVDRGDAVNLARNMLEIHDCKGITEKGVRVLCDAIMRMDAALLADGKAGGEVKFLCNGTRFKMAFFDDGDDADYGGTIHVKCFNNFEKELDGRWVALVAAEDDRHLQFTRPQPAAQVAPPDALRIALEDLDSMEPLGPTTEAVIDAAQRWYLAAPAAAQVAQPLTEIHRPHLCIHPVCGPTCSDCNSTLTPQEQTKYAMRYAYLRSRDLNAINAGGVFAGMTPSNVILNGDDLDAEIDNAIEAAHGIGKDQAS